MTETADKGPGPITVWESDRYGHNPRLRVPQRRTSSPTSPPAQAPGAHRVGEWMDARPLGAPQDDE
jgi:hypothetical protein